jgi:hypothetical protein
MTKPASKDTVVAGVDFAIAAAPYVAAAIGVTPVGMAVIVGAGAVYGAVQLIDPHLTEQIVDGVGTVAKDVFEVDKAEVHVLGKVAGAATEAAADVVTGGVRAVLHFL